MAPPIVLKNVEASSDLCCFGCYRQEETTDELAVLFCTSDLRRRRRLLALRDCGVESSLDSMRETEMELDNKERAHTAYEVFEQFRRFGSTIFR